MTAFDKAWFVLKNENMGLDQEEGGPYMRTPSTRSALADIYGRKEGTVGGPENFGVAPPFNPFHPTYRFNPLTRGDAGGLIHPSKIDPRVRGFAEESAKLVNSPLVKPRQPDSQADREEFQRLFKMSYEDADNIQEGLESNLYRHREPTGRRKISSMGQREFNPRYSKFSTRPELHRNRRIATSRENRMQNAENRMQNAIHQRGIHRQEPQTGFASDIDREIHPGEDKNMGSRVEYDWQPVDENWFDTLLHDRREPHGINPKFTPSVEKWAYPLIPNSQVPSLTPTFQGTPFNEETGFTKSWKFFKEEITDMVEYPPGSQNFVTQQQAQIMQIQERNRQARQALEDRAAMRERLVRYD